MQVTPLKAFRSQLQRIATNLGPRLTRNAIMAVGQSLVVAVSVFLAYREVIRHAGLDAFGMWSVLVAVSAILRIADFSGGGALSRFLASASSQGDPERTIRTAHTVLLTSVFINAALFVLVVFIGPLALPLLFRADQIGEARQLLPWVVFTITLGNLATGVASGIDGMHRADLRATLLSCSAIAFAVVSYFLTASLGLMGFAIAQIVQQATIIMIGWGILRTLLSDASWVPTQWRAEVFATTAPYAAKLGSVSVLGLTVDLIAKIAINATAGAAGVAIFDIASRLIQQVRGMINAAAVTFVPRFAASAPSEEDFRATLGSALGIVFVISVAFPVIVIASSPLVSLIIIGHMSPYFVYVCAALAFGHAVSILAIPTYIAGQAMGVIRWNFLSQFVSATVSVILLLILAPAIGSYAVIGALPLGLVSGALISFWGNLYALRLLEMGSQHWPKVLLAAATAFLLSSGFVFIAWRLGV